MSCAVEAVVSLGTRLEKGMCHITNQMATVPVLGTLHSLPMGGGGSNLPVITNISY